MNAMLAAFGGPLSDSAVTISSTGVYGNDTAVSNITAALKVLKALHFKSLRVFPFSQKKCCSVVTGARSEGCDFIRCPFSPSWKTEVPMQSSFMGKKSGLEVDGRVLQVSNLDKVMYPSTDFTKADVIGYYIKASRVIIPHLKNRPLTLKRYPDGVTSEHFYEKDAPKHKPDWVKTAVVPRKGRAGNINYVLINDVPSLVWAANLASLEMHVFLARAPKIQQPTSIVFDLDPGAPADVLDCARVAIWIRDLVEQFGMKCFVKSSGSKGLQLYIPLNTTTTYEKTQPFAKAIAELLEREHPDQVESEMAKALRTGKVFIDWSQNSEFKTTVCVYSLRAKRETPYVSMPFTWEEVEQACKNDDRDMFYLEPDEALERIEKVGDLFEPVLTLKQKLPAKFEQMLERVELPELAEAKSTVKKSASKPRMRGVGDRSLQAYEAKRDFSRTREPGPKKEKSRNGKELMFVVQKHAASHLHYDFRLEMDGVLKSWAVPKGPPYVRLEKRLAMWVEDHPMSYARFEGIIAPGNYGAGTVMVWDIGTYEVMDGNFHQGKLHMMLHGKKLKGEWVLVRSKKSDDDEKVPWFLIKGGESMDRPKNVDKSVLTRRTMEQIAAAKDEKWESHRKAEPRSKRRMFAK
jgi:bifunctional non-homologous end joining protein LigD